jgi:beta-glucosidase
VQHLGSAVARPVKELRAYKRIALQPGQTRTVALPLAMKSLAYWNPERHRWVVEADTVRINVGSSSADSRLAKTIAVPRSR